MQQNIYDHPVFFSQYQALRDSDTGLNGALEQPALRGALPPLTGAEVLDLGCGFGDFARWARAQGAAGVTAVDLSERMLEQARARTQDQAIQYQCAAIEDFQPSAEAYDLAVSSLALHYVADYAAVAARVFAALKPGGVFALTVEHPICTASPRGWALDEAGRQAHWTLDGYFRQDARETRWFVDGVIKHHRTVESYVAGLLGAGFQLLHLGEPAPDERALARQQGLRPHARRPALLLLTARKPML
ncbi:class I SAM-dependent methyltransferase [Chromobacterium alkanivorans]|uniref:class I SAM-dependent methyltransferase n=1 Tax=Chromobacterium alkanivorans TaxID=1071719 RepID=UPI0019684D7C|nr:class I SAM-dependent methyltransferase [Chromobacterium alkanivorans]MBN3004344.1 class I SAM-dependent methyltransferase [Chromobacterium alkanivorans]